MNFYVYEHWRLDRDECFYVGKGKGRRAYSSSNRNKHWHGIVAKLGRIGSAWEVRIVSHGLNEDAALGLEIERIAFWRSAGADITNISAGGDQPPSWEGKRHSDETRRKIGEANARRVWTEEAREKTRRRMLGQRPSEETRAKLSAARKGREKRKGYKLPEETRAKMSAARKGRVWSIEIREKMSASAKKRWAKVNHE